MPMQRGARPRGPGPGRPGRIVLLKPPDIDPVATAIENFQRRKVERLAESGQPKYRKTLDHFKTCLGQKGVDVTTTPIDTVLTPAWLDDFLEFLDEGGHGRGTRPRTGPMRSDGGHGLAPSTQNGYAAVVMALSRWVSQRYHVPNLLEGYELHDVGPREPRALTLEEVNAGFHIAKKRRYGARDQALWAVAVLTGLRTGELARLRVGHLDDQLTLLEVEREKKRSRQPHPDWVPVKQVLAAILRPYLQERYPCLGTEPDRLILSGTYQGIAARDLPLFPADRHGDLHSVSAEQVGNLLKGILAQAVDRRATAHDLRHTFIVLCVEGHMPLAYVRELVGHSTFDSLRPYLRFDPSRIAAALEEHYPIRFSALLPPGEEPR